MSDFLKHLISHNVTFTLSAILPSPATERAYSIAYFNWIELWSIASDMNLLLWHFHLYKCGFHIPEQNIPLSNIIDCLDEIARWSFSLHCFPRCFVLRTAITCMLPEQNETTFILTHTHTNTQTHTHTNRRNDMLILPAVSRNPRKNFRT
jgi:hypothetical protein